MPLILFKVVKIDGDGPIVLLGDGARQQSMRHQTMTNLRAAIGELPCVIIFDNDDLSASFRAVAVVRDGRVTWSAGQLPGWLRNLLPAR